MLLNIDAKQLEWVGAVYLSQDEIGIDELNERKDIHADNQTRFTLPARTVAKVLLFRTIYGGTGYSFTVDPDFGHLGSESWWDEKIAAFYAKYQGLRAWHERLYERAVLDDGRLVMPTGRVYIFEPHRRGGEVKYPRTKILNYPVQGLAADLMSIARVSLWKRLKHLRKAGLLFVNTVHDSIVLDIPPEIWDNKGDEILTVIAQVFRDVPKNFERLFGVPFNLEMRCEVTVGLNLKEVTECKLPS